MAAMSVGCGTDSRSTNVVVAYVAVDRREAEPILQEFTRQTGIEVRAVYDAEAAKTTGLVSRLVAEADRPRCDLFWNNEIVQTLMLTERGLFDEYAPPSASDIPAKWKDERGRWTGIATRARVIVYNSQLVPHDAAPRTLADLTLPQWRGKVAIANPQFGTTRAHIAALFAARGTDAAQQFLRDLLANDVRIVDGNALVKNLVARADARASAVLVGLTDTDDVLTGQADGEPIAFCYPDQESDGTLIIPSTVAVVRNSPHAVTARRLADFLTSAAVEAALTKPGTGYRPVRINADKNLAKDDVKSLEITYDAWQRQLSESTRWTAEHFHN